MFRNTIERQVARIIAQCNSAFMQKTSLESLISPRISYVFTIYKPDHVKSITWSLFKVKASNLVKWPISALSFTLQMLWCQLIDLFIKMKYKTQILEYFQRAPLSELFCTLSSLSKLEILNSADWLLRWFGFQIIWHSVPKFCQVL